MPREHGELAVTVQSDVPAVMRDGVTLRADVYRPTTGGPYSCVLMRTPYGKRGYFGSETVGTRIASSGYIAVIQDIRGRFASDGEFTPIYVPERCEAEDGFDTVEWAASLPNSTRRVAVFGSSYPAALGWELAATQPPALVTMCLHGTVGDSRQLAPGVFRLGTRLSWNLCDFAPDLQVRRGSSAGPSTHPEAYRLWEFEHGKWFWYLPLSQVSAERLGGLAPAFRRWLGAQERDYLGFYDRVAKIAVPVLHVGSWFDLLVDGIDLYSAMVRDGGSEDARRHQRLLVGPWTHEHIGARGAGDLDFGAEAETTFVEEAVRWFDIWLKGQSNGLGEEPPVKLFVMGANRWRHEQEWPLSRAQRTVLFLRSDGHANTPRGSGGLRREAPGDEPADTFVYDPRDPVPTLFLGPYAYGAPFEQGVLDHRQDVLVYQTEPLVQELEVTGYPEVVLHAACSAPDTDWTAKLVDVYPDGRAYNVCYGFLRARYRDSFEQPSLIEPGRVYEYRIKLRPTSNLFRAGHRIRLDISSSDFPNYDRNHNTGGNDWEETELRSAHQHIFHDANHASQLILPVIPS